MKFNEKDVMKLRKEMIIEKDDFLEKKLKSFIIKHLKIYYLQIKKLVYKCLLMSELKKFHVKKK